MRLIQATNVNRKYTIAFDTLRKNKSNLFASLGLNLLSLVPCVARRSNMPSSNMETLQSDRNSHRKLRLTLWIALTIVFASWASAIAAEIPATKAQIQGGNLRIEFDNSLHSRVV